jgi:hypothetical protein
MITESVDSAVTLLQAAKEKIAEGWCRGTLSRVVAGHRERCASGALMSARTRHTSYVVWHVAQQALLATVTCQAWALHNRTSIAGHNDQCVQTQVEALDWFDRAIAHVKASV